jgi:hypothetical protein
MAYQDVYPACAYAWKERESDTVTPLEKHRIRTVFMPLPYLIHIARSLPSQINQNMNAARCFHVDLATTTYASFPTRQRRHLESTAPSLITATLGRSLVHGRLNFARPALQQHSLEHRSVCLAAKPDRLALRTLVVTFCEPTEEAVGAEDMAAVPTCDTDCDFAVVLVGAIGLRVGSLGNSNGLSWMAVLTLSALPTLRILLAWTILMVLLVWEHLLASSVPLAWTTLLTWMALLAWTGLIVLLAFSALLILDVLLAY